MKKEAFYFPHDTNAIQDPKMMSLLTQCGAYGVGLFWIIIEILHQQPYGRITAVDFRNYINFYGRQHDYNQLTLSECEKVLIGTKLLQIDGEYVFSERVKNNLILRAEKSKKASENVRKRYDRNTAVYDRTTIKERKGKEITTTTRFEKPTAVAVTEYAKSLSFELNGQAFVDYYEANGWKVGRNPMKSWQAAVRTWKTRRSESLPRKEKVVG